MGKQNRWPTDTLWGTGYRTEKLSSDILNVNMRPDGGAKHAKGSKRKIGRHARKAANRMKR